MSAQHGWLLKSFSLKSDFSNSNSRHWYSRSLLLSLWCSDIFSTFQCWNGSSCLVCREHCPCSLAVCDPWVLSAWKSKIFSCGKHQHLKDLKISDEASVKGVLSFLAFLNRICRTRFDCLGGDSELLEMQMLVYIIGVVSGFTDGTSWMPLR